MPETEEISVTGEKVETSEVDYLAAIKELKQSTVAREDYDKLRAENRKLIDAVVNGQTAQDEQPEQKVLYSNEQLNSLRDNLFNHEHTNLEYVQKALELRSALIERGEMDPFLPKGREVTPSRDDIEKANNVAAVFQECIDYAEGDSEVFTQELMRRTKDTAPVKNRR